jgi:hypothetical protein
LSFQKVIAVVGDVVLHRVDGGALKRGTIIAQKRVTFRSFVGLPAYGCLHPSVSRNEVNVKRAAARNLSGDCLVGDPHYLWLVAAKSFYRVRTIAGPRSYRH